MWERPRITASSSRLAPLWRQGSRGQSRGFPRFISKPPPPKSRTPLPALLRFSGGCPASCRGRPHTWRFGCRSARCLPSPKNRNLSVVVRRRPERPLYGDGPRGAGAS